LEKANVTPVLDMHQGNDSMEIKAWFCVRVRKMQMPGNPLAKRRNARNVLINLVPDYASAEDRQ
jgi:hypothetical protein